MNIFYISLLLKKYLKIFIYKRNLSLSKYENLFN